MGKQESERQKVAGIRDPVDCRGHTENNVLGTEKVRDEIAVLSGYDEYFIPNLLAGGAGVISGLNNVMPELFVKAREAWKQNDLAALHDAQREIGKFMSIYTIGEDFETTIKTVVARKFGYCGATSRNFGGELTQAECAQVDEVFGISH